MEIASTPKEPVKKNGPSSLVLVTWLSFYYVVIALNYTVLVFYCCHVAFHVWTSERVLMQSLTRCSCSCGSLIFTILLSRKPWISGAYLLSELIKWLLLICNCRMFTESCRRLRVMKGSDAVGLGMSKSVVFNIPFLF